jgi:hypothetical protein
MVMVWQYVKNPPTGRCNCVDGVGDVVTLLQQQLNTTVMSVCCVNRSSFCKQHHKHCLLTP